jgi:S1-C subfamily serine protease
MVKTPHLQHFLRHVFDRVRHSMADLELRSVGEKCRSAFKGAFFILLNAAGVALMYPRMAFVLVYCCWALVQSLAMPSTHRSLLPPSKQVAFVAPTEKQPTLTATPKRDNFRPIPPKPVLTQEQVVASANESTVLVQVTKTGYLGSGGTGFCVDSAGLFVTNHHVVVDAKDIRLILHPGKPREKCVTATVICSDQSLDLALLRIRDSHVCAALPICSLDNPPGDIIIFGFPHGKPTTSVGKTSTIGGYLPTKFLFNATVRPGNSGSPVLNMRGEVVGVAFARHRDNDGMGYAISAKQLKDFIIAKGG